jgi:hypothetical protein
MSQIAATASHFSTTSYSSDVDQSSNTNGLGWSSLPIGSTQQQSSSTASTPAAAVDGRRAFSSSTGSSSGTSWNHNPHQLPAWTMLQLDIPQHEIEQGEHNAEHQ